MTETIKMILKSTYNKVHILYVSYIIIIIIKLGISGLPLIERIESYTQLVLFCHCC
jgi:hypothetical protein